MVAIVAVYTSCLTKIAPIISNVASYCWILHPRFLLCIIDVAVFILVYTQFQLMFHPQS